MHGRSLLTTLAAVVAAASLLVAAPASQADSIVYMKGKEVWIAQADGSSARQFTLYDYSWASPSEADDGTIVAAGGPGHGPYGDAGSDLYRFSPDGNLLNGPIPTPGTYYTLSCPTQAPWPVRVSPDGSKIAYGTLICSTREDTAVWTPSNATGLDWPDANKGLGTQDFYEPLWFDNTHFLVSHAGDVFGGARWYLHDITGNGSGEPGWSEPSMDATGAQAAVARTGTSFAVFTDDAANWVDGAPRAVSVWLYDAPSLASAETSGWTKRCVVSLDAATMHDPFHLSPSFSPDGSKLLWADDRGVEVASVADLSSTCASFVPHLLVPGASQPFYAKGNLQAAAANPTQPGAPAAGGGEGGTTTTTTPTPTPLPLPTPGPVVVHKLTAAFTVAGKKLRARHAITFDARGSRPGKAAIASYTWKFGDSHGAKGRRVTHRYRKAGRYTVTLTVRDRAGASATMRHRITVHKR